MREATAALSERLVSLLDPRPGETVLELAAGAGDTGFLLAERLGPGGRLLSTDVAPAMVEAARRGAAARRLGNVSFAVADAQELDLEDASVDAVLCRFGLMLVPEPARALAETVRVLRPGGRAAFAVWTEPEHNEWATAAGRTALALGLVERPDPDAPGPFRLADPERLRGLVASAGLALAEEEEVPVAWRYPSLEGWWDVSLDLSRSLRLLLEGLTAAQRQKVRAGALKRLARYVQPGGTLLVPGAARVLLARA